MQDFTKKQKITKAVLVLAEYYNQNLSSQIVDLYVKALEKYDLEKINGLCERFLKTFKYMPKIADFEELLNPALSLDDRAEIAWSLVLKAIEKYSYDKSFTFRDKAIRKTLEIIGYNNIRECLESEINWKKADFIKVYKTYAKLDPNSYPAPDYIAGFIELSNNGSPSPLEEKPGLYLGKSVYIVEDGIGVTHDALESFLKLTGGQNVEYAQIAG
jgi:hypothetical protein